MRLRPLLALGWLLGVYVIFAFAGALASTNGQPIGTDFVHHLRSDSVEMLVLAALILGRALTRDHQARERQGLSTDRILDAVDAEQTLVLNTPYAHAFEATLGAVRSLPGAHAPKADPSTGHITAKVKMSRKTWGEHIRVDLAPVNAEQTRVTVQSHPAFAPTIVDYGKNTANVTKILYELRLSLPPREAA
jgi:hypothetical protein